MHELGIAQEIVAIVAEHAGDSRVTRVVLEIGRHALILPDSIRFCFDLCSEGTAAQGAELDIREIAGRARCRECGSADLQWLSGDEIKVKEMEIA